VLVSLDLKGTIVTDVLWGTTNIPVAASAMLLSCAETVAPALQRGHATAFHTFKGLLAICVQRASMASLIAPPVALPSLVVGTGSVIMAP
jgi:hypothetical protein